MLRTTNCTRKRPLVPVCTLVVQGLYCSDEWCRGSVSPHTCRCLLGVFVAAAPPAENAPTEKPQEMEAPQSRSSARHAYRPTRAVRSSALCVPMFVHPSWRGFAPNVDTVGDMILRSCPSVVHFTFFVSKILGSYSAVCHILLSCFVGCLPMERMARCGQTIPLASARSAGTYGRFMFMLVLCFLQIQTRIKC